jgi:RNA polymerase sigma factor (TIGR02999 family)
MDAQTLAETGQGRPGRSGEPPERRPTDSQPDITGLLLAWRGGDSTALDRLFPLVYDELRRIAHRQLGLERPDHTLGTTALVHEAYLKLVDQTRAQLADRAHFYAVAARAMRRILVDYARGHRAAKRGAGQPQVSLDEATLVADQRADTLVALDEALTRLTDVDARLSRVVECRFFGGLTEEETAEALGVTARTVRRDWVKAKGWLSQALRE